MKFDNNINYCILSNSINNKLLKQFEEYTIINDNIDYKMLLEKIENFPNKTIVLNDLLRSFNSNKVNKILKTIKERNVNYINITSNIEETLYCDYIYVLNENDIVMEGSKETILKEEKILKRLGYGLPFVVDLSTQLICYNVIDKIYYDMESLVDDLWN